MEFCIFSIPNSDVTKFLCRRICTEALVARRAQEFHVLFVCMIRRATVSVSNAMCWLRLNKQLIVLTISAFVHFAQHSQKDDQHEPQ